MPQYYTVPPTGVGLPDYSAPKPTGQVSQGPVFTLTDLAEVAARLKSIDTHDRRGNVIWLDDFEDGITKWFTSTGGVGASAAASADYARNGILSARLVTGDLIDDFADMTHFSPFPVRSRVGFEASYSHVNVNFSIIHQMVFYDGQFEHIAAIRFDDTTGMFQYRDSTGAWVEFCADPILWSVPRFMTLKLVIDLNSFKYVRVIIGNVEYDLSNIDYRHPASAALAQWQQNITLYTAVNANRIIHVDDVILTQNEPVNISV